MNGTREQVIEQVFHSICEAMQQAEEMGTDFTFVEYVSLMLRVEQECEKRIKAAFEAHGKV